MAAQSDKSYGAASMVLPLKRVMLCSPSDANAKADPAQWNYSGKVDLAVARSQHRALVALLTESAVEVTLLEDDALASLPDAIYTHDTSLVATAGAILFRMGKSLRRGEEAIHERAYARMGVPILGRIEAPGTVEDGDCVMVEGFPETVAALEAAGCRVRTFPGSEICTKMEGGPTCLTRPMLRG